MKLIPSSTKPEMRLLLAYHRREVLKLTQAEYAEKLGCSVAMVSLVESGQRRPQPSYVRMAVALERGS